MSMCSTQVQLAAGANEVAVLRQILASVEREHRDAIQRIQERADEEIEMMAHTRSELQRNNAVAEAPPAQEPPSGNLEPPVAPTAIKGSVLQQSLGVGGTTESPSAFPSPVRRIRARGSGTAGGHTGVAEAQLELLQKDYAALAVSGNAPVHTQML